MASSNPIGAIDKTGMFFQRKLLLINIEFTRYRLEAVHRLGDDEMGTAVRKPFLKCPFQL